MSEAHVKVSKSTAGGAAFLAILLFTWGHLRVLGGVRGAGHGVRTLDPLN